MSTTAAVMQSIATAASENTNHSPEVQIYFENSWSILSSSALLLFFAGILVILIVGATALSIVPVVCSAGATLGNGLCYYTFYSNYNWHAKMLAGIFADIGWGFQEIGLPFYSYFILRRILNGKERTFFLMVFWVLITGAISQRTCILVYRTFAARFPERNFVPNVNAHHMGNFALIGATELFSAFFLLKKFYRSRKRAAGISGSNVGLIRQLARSTEVRVAFLAFIGVGRSITYSFMVDALVARNIPSQIDRFAVVAETMFPMILYIDLLGSKAAGKSTSRSNTSETQSSLYQSSSKSSRFIEKIRSPMRAHNSRGVPLDSIANDFPEYAGSQAHGHNNTRFPAIAESNGSSA